MGEQVVASGATWGISGPEFLGLYAGLVLLVMVGVAVRRRGLWRPVVPTGPVWLHPYEVAYLNGGARCAAETVLVGLGVAGVLKPGTEKKQEKKTVQLTGRDLPPGLTGPDHAAIALAGTESAYDQLRDALKRRPEYAHIKVNAVTAGYAAVDVDVPSESVHVVFELATIGDDGPNGAMFKR